MAEPQVNDDPQPLPKDAAYWETEAKKAFVDRDAAKRRAKELEGKVWTDEDRQKFVDLQEKEAKAEDERKRKAGEFDQWREQIAKKHQTELDAEKKRAEDADAKWRKTHLGLAFASATDLFGKDALTIYSAAAGQKIFGDRVRIEDDGSAVVLDGQGNVIVDATTGKPASLSTGLREVIESLPDQADHLRGSGKVGSGSPGGSNTPVHPADVTELTRRANAGDKAAIEALRTRRNGSTNRLVIGSALSR